MKDWLRFFLLSFFSDKTSKEAQKRSYANFFLALLLVLGFLWIGFFGGNMFPFKAHYKNSPDFKSTVRAVFANPDTKMRIGLQVGTNTIKAKIGDGEYKAELLVNTYESQTDNKNYSVGGYGAEIHEMSEMAAADLGQCAISNQPSFHIPFVYSELGDVKKTAELVNRLSEEFSATPEGYPGDEDNGSMSAWYVLACLGLYQMCPSRAEFTMSLPLFEKIIVKLSNGNLLKISKAKADPNKTKNIVSYFDIMNGGDLNDIAMK